MSETIEFLAQDGYWRLIVAILVWHVSVANSDDFDSYRARLSGGLQALV